jgi:hypothetical protein
MSLSKTPLSDAAEPRCDEFHAKVKARFNVGRRAYGDSSFAKPIDQLVTEIQEELEDVAGWSAILWARLDSLKSKVSNLPK